MKSSLPRPESMIISTFFNSYAGMYVTQSFCHSLIASVIMDQAVRAWSIDDPAIRQRFRLSVVFFPILSFPLYQFINPDRGSLIFRLDALFDVNRWLTVELGGVFPLSILFLAVLAVTSLVFLLQEMLPILSHSLGSRNIGHEGTPFAAGPFLEKASQALSIETPAVRVEDDDDLVIFSTTGRNPVVFMSSGLVGTLTADEMQAALAHELAHIARSRRPVLLAVFFLRILLFFNPVALIEFRRVVRNEEKICDDIAVSLTGRPAALAEALTKFYSVHGEAGPGDRERPLGAPVSLEEYSYNLQIDSRISRLKQGARRSGNGQWIPFIVSAVVIAGLNYFIV